MLWKPIVLVVTMTSIITLESQLGTQRVIEDLLGGHFGSNE